MDENQEIIIVDKNNEKSINTIINLDDTYEKNLKKLIKDLTKNRYIDPLRMINSEGILPNEEGSKNINYKKKYEILKKVNEFFDFKIDENKIRILILTLQNNNDEAKLVINLKEIYVLGFINKENIYFYFKEKNEWKKNEVSKINNFIKKQICNNDLNKFKELEYSGDYSFKDKNKNIFGLGAVTADNEVRNDITISKDNLNQAIENLTDVKNVEDLNKQDTKDHLVRMIFITSEAMRFDSHIKYFPEHKDKDGNLVKFKNIPEKVQKILNDDIKDEWSKYINQLRGGYRKATEEINKYKEKIFALLDEEIIYSQKVSDFLNVENLKNVNFQVKLNTENIEKIINLALDYPHEPNFELLGLKKHFSIQKIKEWKNLTIIKLINILLIMFTMQLLVS